MPAHKFKPQESVSSSENGDIFCMYTINDESNEEKITEIKVVEIEEIPGLQFIPPSTSSEPSEYVKHSYLDLKPLTCREQFRLIRLHYLTLPNIVYYLTIVLCVVWFFFNVYQVGKDYIEKNTIVIVEYNSSVSSRPPAISICTTCLLCASFNANQTIYYQDILENDLILAMLDKNGREVYATDPRVPPIDVKIDCRFLYNTIDDPFNSINCDNFTDVIISFQKSRKCWVYLSEVYPISQPLKPKINMQYDYQPNIFFRVSGQMFFENDSSIEVAIHSPNVMPVAIDAIGHKLELAKAIDLRFAKQEWKLRPGYEPRCFQY